MGKNAAEQLFRLTPAEKEVLARCMVVAVPGGHGDTVDTEIRHVVEEVCDLLRIFAVEQGAVDRDPVSGRLGFANGR